MRLGLKAGMLALVASLAIGAEAPPGIKFTWQPVSTPGFVGPPKIIHPGFVPPIMESILMPETAECLVRKGAGNYEALIAADGRVESIQSRRREPIAGDECEKRYLFPYIIKWRFKPATFEGRPTSVHIAIQMSTQGMSPEEQ